MLTLPLFQRSNVNLDNLFGPSSPPGFLNTEHLVSHTNRVCARFMCVFITNFTVLNMYTVLIYIHYFNQGFGVGGRSRSGGVGDFQLKSESKVSF